MTNVTGLSFLNVEMHARLWDALLSQDWDRGPHVLDLDLQALRARVLAHRLDDPDDEAFAVEILDRNSRTRPATGPNGARPRPIREQPAAGGRSKSERSVGDRAQRLRQAARRTEVAALRGPPNAPGARRRRSHRPELVAAGGDGHARRRRAPSCCGGSKISMRARSVLSRRWPTAYPSDRAYPAHRPAGPTGVHGRPEPGAPSAVLRMLSQVAVGVDVPALAGRGQDIPSIAQALLAEIEPRQRPVLSAATMQVLMRWDWPGNVAELRHVLLGFAAELPGQSVSPYHLPERMWDAANRRPLTRIESAERTEILAALRQSGGNRSKAASLLGIGRTTLYRKLHALGIDDNALLVVAADVTRLIGNPILGDDHPTTEGSAEDAHEDCPRALLAAYRELNRWARVWYGKIVATRT